MKSSSNWVLQNEVEYVQVFNTSRKCVSGALELKLVVDSQKGLKTDRKSVV